MNFKKAISTAVVLSMLTLLMLASWSFGDACCLSDTYVAATMKTAFEAQGYTNVTASSTCTQFTISGTLPAPSTGTFSETIKVINGTSLETSVTIAMGAYNSTTKDTLDNWCQIAVEKKPAALVSITTLTTSPNPFTSQVAISFENAAGNATLQVFDAKGVKVFEQKNISGNSVTWKPANLKPGMYVAKVGTRARTYTQRIICIK